MTQNERPAPRRASDRPEATDRPSSAARRAKSKAAADPVSPTVARQIDENLKRLYHQQVEQDLPPALQALVARLRSGDRAPGSDAGRAIDGGDDEGTT